MRLLRFVIIGALLGGALWGFHINAEKRIAAIAERDSSVRDRTRTLSAEQEKDLEIFLRRFYETYGLVLKVEVHPRPCDAPALTGHAPPGELTLALCPGEGRAVLSAPPAAVSLLGEPSVLYLRAPHFMPYFSRGDWPAGLAAALNLINDRLAKTLRAAPQTETK